MTIGVVDADPVMKLHDHFTNKSHNVFAVFTPKGLNTIIRVTNQGVFIPDTIVSALQREPTKNTALAFVQQQRSFRTTIVHNKEIEWKNDQTMYTLQVVSNGQINIPNDDDL